MQRVTKNLLTELYPWERSKGYRWRSILFFGLFVFLFLFIFQPFGLINDFPNKTAILLGYGILTSFGVWIFNMVLPSLFPAFFTEEKWYVWKEILITLAAILFIAFLNLLYSYLLGFFHLNFLNFVIFIGITLALGIFPVTISILLTYNYALNKHQRTASIYTAGLNDPSNQKSNTATERLILNDENGELLGNWKVDNILRIEAAQNYIEVYTYGPSNSEINRELLRITMKEVEQQTKQFDVLMRTHRSHIVNLDQIHDVKGNAQGLQLSLRGSEHPVPVSRSRIPYFRKAHK